MKHISILAIHEQNNLSTVACMVGAYEIFAEANACRKRSSKNPLVKIEFVSSSKHKTGAGEMFIIKPHASIDDIHKTDLIIIPSSLVRSYETATKNNKKFIDWIEQQYRRGAEVASMCTGTFLLASTGLLEGKTCSTHWSAAGNFGLLFPNVNLQTDKLITDESGIYTNGRAYSFLHLIIYLVEKYFFDRQTAVYCAIAFQIDLDRHLQAEFSIFNGHKKHNDETILEIQAYIENNHPDKILTDSLASKFGTSRRNFDRRFSKATGLTPLDYLQRVRVEAAKKAFENTRKTVGEVMFEVGYNDTRSFREVFGRITGMSPVAYKSKYNKVG